MYYSDRYFKLIDPFDGWTVAYCFVGHQWTESNLNIVKFWPSVYCDKWVTINDGSLDPDHMSEDYTFSIDQQGTCSNAEALCPDDDIEADEICLERNSVMHSFLEGQYQKTGVQGINHGTYEYERTEKLLYDGKYHNVYIWFYGEISDTLKWWVISPNNYTTGLIMYGLIDLILIVYNGMFCISCSYGSEW